MKSARNLYISHKQMPSNPGTEFLMDADRGSDDGMREFI